MPRLRTQGISMTKRKKKKVQEVKIVDVYKPTRTLEQSVTVIQRVLEKQKVLRIGEEITSALIVQCFLFLNKLVIEIITVMDFEFIIVDMAFNSCSWYLINYYVYLCLINAVVRFDLIPRIGKETDH